MSGAGVVIGNRHALPVEQYLTRGPGQPYPHGVAEAVLLSLQAVRAGDRAGACGEVLELLSVLSAAGVRRDLLYAAGQAGALADGSDRLDAAVVDEALGRLAEWSLLAFSVDGQAAAAVLDTRARALDGSLDRAAVRDVPEQVTALGQAAAGLAGGPGELEAILLRLRRWALYLLNQLGDSAAQAIAVGEPLLKDAGRVLGAHDSVTLASQNDLAVAYRAAGRYAEAIALHQQTLADWERVLGPVSPDTLALQNNLAEAYGAAGRYAEAIQLFEQTLADRERMLGPDHPDTLGSRNNLAEAYREAGRYAEAIPLHEQTLADRERVLGPDHPDTLASRNNLALAYQAAGRYAEAIPLHEQTAAFCAFRWWLQRRRAIRWSSTARHNRS